MDDILIATASQEDQEELKQIYLFEDSVSSAGLVIALEKHYRPWHQHARACSQRFAARFFLPRTGRGGGDIDPL